MPIDPDIPGEHLQPGSPRIPIILDAKVVEVAGYGQLIVTVQELDGGAQARDTLGCYPAAKPGDLAWVYDRDGDMVAVAWQPVGTLPSWPTSRPL